MRLPAKKTFKEVPLRKSQIGEETEEEKHVSDEVSNSVCNEEDLNIFRMTFSCELTLKVQEFNESTSDGINSHNIANSTSWPTKSLPDKGTCIQGSGAADTERNAEMDEYKESSSVSCFRYVYVAQEVLDELQVELPGKMSDSPLISLEELKALSVAVLDSKRADCEILCRKSSVGELTSKDLCFIHGHSSLPCRSMFPNVLQMFPSYQKVDEESKEAMDAAFPYVKLEEALPKAIQVPTEQHADFFQCKKTFPEYTIDGEATNQDLCCIYNQNSLPFCIMFPSVLGMFPSSQKVNEESKETMDAISPFDNLETPPNAIHISTAKNRAVDKCKETFATSNVQNECECCSLAPISMDQLADQHPVEMSCSLLIPLEEFKGMTLTNVDSNRKVSEFFKQEYCDESTTKDTSLKYARTSLASNYIFSHSVQMFPSYQKNEEEKEEQIAVAFPNCKSGTVLSAIFSHNAHIKLCCSPECEEDTVLPSKFIAGDFDELPQQMIAECIKPEPKASGKEYSGFLRAETPPKHAIIFADDRNIEDLCHHTLIGEVTHEDGISKSLILVGYNIANENLRMVQFSPDKSDELKESSLFVSDLITGNCQDQERPMIITLNSKQETALTLEGCVHESLVLLSCYEGSENLRKMQVLTHSQSEEPKESSLLDNFSQDIRASNSEITEIVSFSDGCQAIVDDSPGIYENNKPRQILGIFIEDTALCSREEADFSMQDLVVLGGLETPEEQSIQPMSITPVAMVTQPKPRRVQKNWKSFLCFLKSNRRIHPAAV